MNINKCTDKKNNDEYKKYLIEFEDKNISNIPKKGIGFKIKL